MSNAMFKIKDPVAEEAKIVSLDALKAFALSIAQENKMELVDKEGWMEFVHPGHKLDLGHALKSFRDDISEISAFAVSHEILSSVGYEVSRVLLDGVEEKIEWIAIVPGSMYDCDQILYQLGFASSVVSRMKLFIDGVHLASYGSKIVGTQTVMWCHDQTGDPVTIGQGEAREITNDPKLMLRLLELEKQTGDAYLSYVNRCGLSPYFESPDGGNLIVFNDRLRVSDKFTYHTIADGIGLDEEMIEEILAALDNRCRLS